jgi:Fe-S-cluster-containing hydrogenase component 2
LKHSVTLDREKCKGCTTCIKQCPTEAIRVRNGKAFIIEDRCIDCGRCVLVCPHHAKKAVTDPFEKIFEYKYKVALPAPSLYGQFNNLYDVNIVLQGLLDIGFDAVFEVSGAAEMISDITRRDMIRGEKYAYPVISSACPACVRLISMRFPNLVKHILPSVAPVDLAAIKAREKAVRETGLTPEDIGVFFISPCPAKVTAVSSPIGLSKPVLDGAISMADIYLRLLDTMDGDKAVSELSTSGIMGIGWAASGGEGAALLSERSIAVDGSDHVIRFLEDIENEKLPDLRFVELNACTQGCVGGCLTVENPFIAKARVKRLVKYLPVSRSKADPNDAITSVMFWDSPVAINSAEKLSEDFGIALGMMEKIERLSEELPGLDCGSCGAPTCRALAEDVARGDASENDCIFNMRRRMQYLAGAGEEDSYLPPPFRKEE